MSVFVNIVVKYSKQINTNLLNIVVVHVQDVLLLEAGGRYYDRRYVQY